MTPEADHMLEAKNRISIFIATNLEPDLKQAIREMMKAAFDNSIVHSIAFDEYLEAIRQGRNPLEEARARASPEPDTDLDGERPNQHQAQLLTNGTGGEYG
jgi:hypothetical protein